MDDKQALTGQQVHDEGLTGWRQVLDRLVVRFDTGGFSAGAALVVAIAEAADEANHHPDVDLRYPHLTVSLKSHDVDAITQRDIRLARRITELAEAAGARAAPSAPDVIELALDTPDHERVLPFWQALLGHEPHLGDDLVDPAARTPSVWFQASDSEAPDRQRWHLDISVPHDVVQERIAAAVEAGGRVVDESRAPAFWVLEDPDGNRSCLCTWQARD